MKNEEWVSIIDNIPEPGKQYLVFEDGNYKVLRFYNENKWEGEKDFRPYITHYMEVPKKPKKIKTTYQKDIGDPVKLLSDIFGYVLFENMFSIDEKKCLSKHFMDIVETLPEREKITITSRYGLNGSFQRTLNVIGGLIGVGREQVRRIEASALRKFRHPSRIKYLVKYIDNYEKTIKNIVYKK